MKMKWFLLSVPLLFLLNACSSVPMTGRSQFLITSPAYEAQLGDQAWAELNSTEKASSNADFNNALQRVGEDIAASAKEAQGFQWAFKVFDNAEANAFCLPGGKVGVYSGLFAYTANDAELSTVVAHEVGHAIARHSGERISQQSAANLGANVVATAVESDLAGSAFALGAQYGAILPYSREHEYEADYIGLLLMSRAGYDPNAAVTFWEKFGRLGNESRLAALFSTHPMSSDRLAELKAKLPEALALYRNSKQKGLGTVYSQTLQTQAAQSRVVTAPAPSSNTTSSALRQKSQAKGSTSQSITGNASRSSSNITGNVPAHPKNSKRKHSNR